MKELLIGCGNRRIKELWQGESGAVWDDLTTLDIDPRCEPHVVHDLNDIPLPFPDETFDEIHAYEVLEHCGRQGDVDFFFKQFNDFWRILRPGGVICGSVPGPTSAWVWADPGHARQLRLETFVFLCRPAYTQIGNTPMSDYRALMQCDFQPVKSEATGDRLFFVLRAIKPMRL